MARPFAEFDAERRAFTKLEIKRIRQQQAHDTVEGDMMAKLEARNATLSGETYFANCLGAKAPLPNSSSMATSVKVFCTVKSAVRR